MSGLCLDSLGSSCLPKKTKVEVHPITVYVNSTPYCTSIELEHHRGPCRCECPLGPASCTSRQHFLPSSCSCQCLPRLTRDKLDCLNSSSHTWDSQTCQCSCKNSNSKICPPGQFFSQDTCQCRGNNYNVQCDFSAVPDSPFSNNDKVYLVNFIFLCVAVIIVIIVIMFVLMFRCRNPPEELTVTPSPALGELALVGRESDYTLTLTRRIEEEKH